MDYGSIVPLRSAQTAAPIFVYPWNKSLSWEELVKAARDLPEVGETRPTGSAKLPSTKQVGAPKPPLHTPGLKLAHYEGIHAVANNELQNWRHHASLGHELTDEHKQRVQALQKIKNMASQGITHLRNQGVQPSVHDYDTLAVHHLTYPHATYVQSGGKTHIGAVDLAGHAQHSATMLGMQQQAQAPTSAAGALASTGAGSALKPEPMDPETAPGWGPRGRREPALEQPTPTPTQYTTAAGEATQAEDPERTLYDPELGTEARTSPGTPGALAGRAQAPTPAPRQADQPTGQIAPAPSQVAYAPDPVERLRQQFSQAPSAAEALAAPSRYQRPALQPLPSLQRSLMVLKGMMDLFQPAGLLAKSLTVLADL